MLTTCSWNPWEVVRSARQAGMPGGHTFPGKNLWQADSCSPRQRSHPHPYRLQAAFAGDPAGIPSPPEAPPREARTVEWEFLASSHRQLHPYSPLQSRRRLGRAGGRSRPAGALAEQGGTVPGGARPQPCEDNSTGRGWRACLVLVATERSVGDRTERGGRGSEARARGDAGEGRRRGLLEVGGGAQAAGFGHPGRVAAHGQRG